MNRRVVSRAGVTAVVAALLALGPPAAAAQALAPLTVADLLAAVDRAFPLIAQARADLDAARGDRRAADGAFDTTLRTGALRTDGEYDNERASLSVSQPLALWGLTASGGLTVRRGGGSRRYDGKADTDGVTQDLDGTHAAAAARTRHRRSPRRPRDDGPGGRAGR